MKKQSMKLLVLLDVSLPPEILEIQMDVDNEHLRDVANSRL